MKEDLLKRNYIHVGETYLKVIEENGKDPDSKRFMWLYRSGGIENPIILYDYQKTRSSSCAEEFLEGFSGYLQTDGYDGYNRVKYIKKLYCAAHIRRKFFQIISTLSPEALKHSRALEGFNYCEQLYEIEKKLREQYIGSDDYKNWMFSKTVKGAKSSAVIYSIVETAKANSLAVEKVLSIFI